jgi:hypothetical protein
LPPLAPPPPWQSFADFRSNVATGIDTAGALAVALFALSAMAGLGIGITALVSAQARATIRWPVVIAAISAGIFVGVVLALIAIPRYRKARVRDHESAVAQGFAVYNLDSGMWWSWTSGDDQNAPQPNVVRLLVDSRLSPGTIERIRQANAAWVAALPKEAKGSRGRKGSTRAPDRLRAMGQGTTGFIPLSAVFGPAAAGAWWYASESSSESPTLLVIGDPSGTRPFGLRKLAPGAGRGK